MKTPLVERREVTTVLGLAGGYSLRGSRDLSPPEHQVSQYPVRLELRSSYAVIDAKLTLEDLDLVIERLQHLRNHV